MSLEVTHIFLVEGEGCAACKQLAERFLAKTQLVKYDVIHIENERCQPAQALGFWQAAEAGVAANRRFIEELSEELIAGGYSNIKDFLNETEGFPSKVLHIIAHVLDGFFGIDSGFYNLVEDSHFISAKLKQKIRSTPERFWLIEVECQASSQADASAIHATGNKAE